MGYQFLGSGGITVSPATIAPKVPIVGVPQGQQPYVYVKDLTTGDELYLKNPDNPSDYPASCCKMMTALLVWEYHGSNLDATLTVTAADVTQPAGYSTDFAGLAAGDVISYRDLLYCLFLPSGADAVQAMARVIGNELYAAAGNTGNTGMTRFVERMNARAAELGMTNTYFENPFGGSRTGTTTRCKMSARDMATLAAQCFSHSILRTISIAPTHGCTITGGRTTTLNITAYNRYTNGPTDNQQGVSDPTYLAGKNGSWNDNSGSYNSYNLASIWQAPNGNEILIVTIGSVSLYALMLDHRGVQYQLVRDFPYLLTGASVGSDAHFSSVKLLIGADGATVTDESSVANTVTMTNAGLGSPIVAESLGSMYQERVDGMMTVADSASLYPGTGDMTFECWTAATNASGGEYAPLFKGNPNKEWCFEWYGNNLNIFVSTDGANWNSTTAKSLSSLETAVLFNGAPRHWAFVKSGSTWALYVNGERFANTLTASAAYDSTSLFQIGYQMQGALDEIRYTVGYARYTTQMFNIVCRKFPRS